MNSHFTDEHAGEPCWCHPVVLYHQERADAVQEHGATPVSVRPEAGAGPTLGEENTDEKAP